MTSVSAVAKNPEKHEKQVNKIKIQGERTYDSSLPYHFSIEPFRLCKCHVLYLLRIIGRQPDKYHNPDIAYCIINGGTVNKYVDDRGNDNSYEPHP